MIQRFIGGSAWRQDEQTFDAVRIDTRQGQFDASYIYIAHVNRIFAEDQDWDSDSHVRRELFGFRAVATRLTMRSDFSSPARPPYATSQA